MKTTVDIPDKLYGQACKLAAARGQQVVALITEGLQKLLIEQPPLPRAKAGRNGKPGRLTLPAKAARWLREWRALGQSAAGGTPTSSAAETVSRMRRRD